MTETDPTPRPAARTLRPLHLALLTGIAIVAPAIGFAGISVIWPSSSIGADVDETPLITFSAGSDHAQAQAMGYAGAFATSDNGAAYTLTLYGLSGGTVTIDDLITIHKDAAVSSYKVQVGDALAGIAPTTLKARLWTGGSAPTSDASPGVCAVLDLTSVAATESSGACSGSAKMQIVYALPSGQTTQSGTVTLRASSITV